MTTVVLDASAIIELSVGESPEPALRRLLLTNQAVAPELLDVEVASVLRRLAARGELEVGDAEEILSDILDAPIERVSHRPLMRRAWQLRHTITAYDATYVALAERLDATLATCDARLAGSNGHDARIAHFAAS
ncbi:MAG: type II toxin-antitoxin system VapC family toxin [Micromonosporaceae bacterium]